MIDLCRVRRRSTGYPSPFLTTRYSPRQSLQGICVPQHRYSQHRQPHHSTRRMSFAGLSLPHRRYPQDQLRKLTSESPPKFRTVNIGPSLFRRRANVASVFSRSRENDASSPSSSRQTPADEPKTPLATVPTNIQPAPDTRTKPESRPYVDGPFLPKFGELSQGPQPKYDDLCAFPTRSRSTASFGRSTSVDARLGRARSASSTYPSEGLSSPVEKAKPYSSDGDSHRCLSFSSIANSGAWRS